MIRPLLDDWSAVARRLREASALALFLDFDGTLAPLTGDPRQAKINPRSRQALTRMGSNPKVHTCVISGRRRTDLREMAGDLPGVIYLGVHGGDGPVGLPFPREILKTVEQAQRELAERLNGSSGVVIEDKGIGFAVHHRHARPLETVRAHRILEQVVQELKGALRIMSGDRVWEVLPREIRGKGEAVRRLWRRHTPEAMPIYVGNDATDEGAFRVLNEGITARVGAARPTRAHYFLRDCSQVARFLEQMEQEIRWAPSQGSSS